MKRHRGPRSPHKLPQLVDRLAFLVLAALVLLPPLVFDAAAKDSFRLPKELLCEILALASLLLLSFRLRSVGRVDWRRLAGHPAVLAAVPLLAVATLGWLVTSHPLHVRQGWASLAVGVAALVGWSLALRVEERRRLLALLVAPAALLSLVVILQYHQVWDPFQFGADVSRRRALTSLAGGAIDLGAYLVLPALVAQLGAYRAASARARWGWGAVLAACLYATALTQTLTALVALGAASFVLWRRLLPGRRLLATAALLVVVAGALGWGIGPLRGRALEKFGQLQRGELNTVLTGRLDGWRAALRMLESHRWLGVGIGAYSTEFADAKIELTRRGVAFFGQHLQPHFDTAHSEFLEAAAELGGLGLAALGWGLWVLARELARKASALSRAGEAPAAPAAADLTLMYAGTTALVVLASTSFPLHLAVVAYPHLLLASGCLRPGGSET